MKKIYLLFLVSIISIAPLFAQKFMPVHLTFKDGSVKEGFIKRFAPNDKTIKFRLSEESKTENFKSQDIQFIHAPAQDGGVITFENVKAQNHRKGIIVKKLIEGPVTLYHMRVHQGALGMMDHYMLKRPHEEKCTLIIALTIAAKRQLKNYFEDSPLLVDKIR